MFHEVASADESRAHDLELAPPSLKNKAVVRTSFETVVVDLPSTGAITAHFVPSPNGSNAHEYVAFEQSQNQPLFSSDSVTTFKTTSNVTIAMTIGALQLPTTPPSWQGYVDFIDATNAVPVFLAQATITGPGGFQDPGAIPLDLALTRDLQELAVRSAATLPNAPTSPGGDVTFFSTSTYSALADYGGIGFVMGVDSIQAGTNSANGRKRIVSIAEDRTAPDGKVHLVDRP